jgi:hypothetical protein
MINRISLQIALLTGALVCSAVTKDAISASVSNFTLATPTVSVNGNPAAPGTFAVGTIQLWYEVHAYQFTAGPLATFDLTLQDYQPSTTGQAPSYPATLNVMQIGGTSVTLTPVPSTFVVSGLGWSGNSTVSIGIPVSTAGNPAFAADGTELVGNLKLSTVPAGSKLDTTTNVQVHVRLVHPTSCLRVYDFMTTQDLSTSISSLQVDLFKNGPKAGRTKGTTPPQLSNDVLIVNVCASEEIFDLMLHNDSSFQDQGANSVFMFTKSGSTDPSTFEVADFGAGTPKGNNHCFGSLYLPGGDSVLVTNHLSIADIPAAQLPPGSFGFSGLLAVAGTGCPGIINTLAIPNPASLSVPFSISQ